MQQSPHGIRLKSLEGCTPHNAELFTEEVFFPRSLTKFQMARLFLAVGDLNIEAGQKKFCEAKIQYME